MKSQQKKFKLIKFKETLSRMEKTIPNNPLEDKKIKSVRVLRRVLTEDVIAEKALPDHDFAAMDRYTMRTQNIQNTSENNPVKLNNTGELYPSNHPTKASIGASEAIYAVCDAPIANGVDAIIKADNQADKYHAVPSKKHLSILKNLVGANGYAITPTSIEKNKNSIIDIKIFGGLEFFNIMS
jgi:molybdopterin biosynthesis enzyme